MRALINSKMTLSLIFPKSVLNCFVISPLDQFAPSWFRHGDNGQSIILQQVFSCVGLLFAGFATPLRMGDGRYSSAAKSLSAEGSAAKFSFSFI